MTDIVERLRAWKSTYRGDGDERPIPLAAEAADEIQKLREAWRIQHAEKVAERAEAKLWFGKAQEWKAEIESLRAENQRLCKQVADLERAVLKAAAPDFLTESEREALRDFVQFLRSTEA